MPRYTGCPPAQSSSTSLLDVVIGYFWGDPGGAGTECQQSKGTN
jgi:hypothetical protein